MRLFAILLFSVSLSAQTVSFQDPAGDDDGPGTYVYPTDAVYTRGSYDLTGFTLTKKGTKFEAKVDVAAPLADPWQMGTGFSVQMVFVFIDMDGKTGSGHTEGLPGLNIRFAPSSAWEKVILLSPQAPSRVNSEVETKASGLEKDVIVPRRTRGSGHSILSTIDAALLGDGDPTTWSYQVVMQGNEGFPSGNDLLTRKVNEYEGQHRFGGGNDEDCDPHVLDLLAGSGSGAKDEIAAQHKMLAYTCDGSSALATVSMVRAR
jgi:carbohydrate-binding DOMON domain-containing protein